MPGIGDDQVRRVRDAIDLVQLISDYTPLRKAGSNYIGCCPFHQERSPSFHVYTDHYHCYGCGAHGDAITLIREKERCEFMEAVEILARRAGIELVRTQEGAQARAARSQRDALVALYAFATSFYEEQLRVAPAAQAARDYLASRHLSRTIAERFRLGWAPGHGLLLAAARRAGFDAQLLVTGDLAIDRDGRLTDRFYERVTFPIGDRFGNPIAFSARLLPAAERAAKEAGRGVGKYVNSTETPLYRKGATVFNLHRAKAVARDRGRIIVMEGPTDVMAADQAGFGECVAVLGTALTPDHARQLGQIAGADGRVIILLDGDRAGVANSLKAVRTCLAAHVPVHVALLPDELDPAELLAEGGDGAAGRATFERVLAEARPDVRHLLHLVAPSPHALDPRGLVEAIDTVVSALRPIPDPDLRALHLRDCGVYLGVPPGRLEQRLAASAPAAPAPRSPAADPALPPLSTAAETALHVLLREPALRAEAADTLGIEPSDFPTPWDLLAAAALLGAADPAQDPAVAAHPGLLAAAHHLSHMALADRQPAIGDPRGRLAEVAATLGRERDAREALRLRQALIAAESAGDFAQVRILGRTLAELRQRGV
jgi:DNA primase